MVLDDDYKDFRAFRLTDNGEKEELDIELEDVEDLLSSEGVFLLVRNDLRRIFIWKGPKSPVRKRFISSRVGSRIQEEASQIGRHLKIVSIDAGDELVEFLHAFNLKSYEVSEDEKLDDMYYIRNEERRKLEEEKLAKELKGKNKAKHEQDEYWSPILEEKKRLEKIKKTKDKAVLTTQEISKSIGKPIKKKINKKQTPTPISHGYKRRPSKRTFVGAKPMKLNEEKEILDLILKKDCPKGYKRLNIILGTSLYGAKRTISELFGKEIEEIQWAKVKKIPDGNIDIETNLLRVYCKNNLIQGLEILSKIKEIELESKPKNSAKQKKALKEIPKGE